MKKILIVFAAALAVFAVEAQGQRRPSGGGPAQQPRGQMARPSGRGGDRGARSRHNGADGELSKQDRRLIEDIESAESSQELRRYLQAAISSRSEDVRMAMVNALESEEGKRSLADLAYFIADPSEDVAEAAFSAWTMALSDARSDRRVRAILEAAQILQGYSKGQWQGHGYGASHGPMTAPGAVPPSAGPLTAPGAVPPSAGPMAMPGAVPPQPVPVAPVGVR